jgi:type VI secretion system protein ImpL
MILFVLAQTTQLPSGNGDDNFWFVLAGVITLTAALCSLVFFMLSGQQNLPLRLMAELVTMRKERRNNIIFQHSASISKDVTHCFWRVKPRLLLITGDEAAIEQLVPGLQKPVA